MSFFTDKQTLDDLNITGRYKNNSITFLFDQVITTGGIRLLEHMFRQPLTDPAEINKRSDIFKRFTAYPSALPFSAEEFVVLEDYLGARGSLNRAEVIKNAISKKALQVVAQDEAYSLFNSGIISTIKLLIRFRDFIDTLETDEGLLREQLIALKDIFRLQKLQKVLNVPAAKELPLFKMIKYDYLLRCVLKKEMEKIIESIFQFDVYTAVAAVARDHHFCYATALPKARNVLNIQGLYHPTVEKAVGNTITLNQENNVLFLTGANMAGKSTLMKSMGIAVYLAHMGFPVAAEAMEFSVRDGLYTSINMSDNIGLGYSHFYAEVLRVKKVATDVAADKDLVVIFDELFKGTNVKDAYDATLAITEAFSENRNCFFMISTHITEVGEILRERCNNFRFTYLPTIMQGLRPRYTYRLTEGITMDRHGMTIIRNEGILDLLQVEAAPRTPGN
ncbi:MutS-related protein [Mucilaginibacter ginsenosidivorax]|uniref:DNA mismatch repair protein n=1 Tax=Mucilaginibacter ginsenosidivorax TaxID=862126 RepID=A0A5B8W9E8_9SPHI|nr:DNA mismatch repair protein [Mucilaginibacter ginsenosidivorax]QEC78878.1 DNA mismatch repair protein [Mucilaginibacter ginsenosidivorax]